MFFVFFPFRIKEEKENLRKAEEKRMIEFAHQSELGIQCGRTAQFKEEEKQRAAKSQRNRESARYTV